MKTLLAVALIAVSPAFASHFITAQVEVKVVQVDSPGRLDGVVIYSYDKKIADHDQSVTVEVVKASSSGRTPAGFKVGERITLNVKKDQIGQWKKDDVLKLDYRNVGDARASRVSWQVVK